MSNSLVKICAHCGSPTMTAASINGADVCHANWMPGVPLADQDDCYRLITVYGETLGSRRPEQSVREQIAAELDRQAYQAAVGHVDGPNCVEAVTWAHAARIARGTAEGS